MQNWTWADSKGFVKKVLKRRLGLKSDRKKQENGENCLVLSFTTCTFHVYLWLLNEAVSNSESYKYSCLNLAVEWSAFLSRIEQVPCSNLGPDTG
jgi:hypothetical protein